jgi:aspartyl-tRNA(Asn)/glutamyl-tRNA(Gln) amidotransferase subunit A
MIVSDFRRVFGGEEKVDVLVTPTCLHDTALYSDYLKQEQVFDEKDFFTACANIAGVPAISVPCRMSDTRPPELPVGVQFMADWDRDEFLCNVAQWFIQNNSENFAYKK